jgi:hypothetical protein
LWDVGVPTQFGARKKWLALYNPATGAVRAVFTTLEAANAFTTWVQQAGAVTAGKYSLGLFTPVDRNEEEPILPSDASIMETFQPISAFLGMLAKPQSPNNQYSRGSPCCYQWCMPLRFDAKDPGLLFAAL